MIHFCSDTMLKDVMVKLKTDYIEPSSHLQNDGDVDSSKITSVSA